MAGSENPGVELLLVEDNPDDARFVRRLVTEYQSDIEPRETGRPIEIDDIDHVDRLADGLERVRTRPPDVILLDLVLPDSAGLETVDRMVEHAPIVPIVVLTGRDEAELGVEAIRRGAAEYLVKGALSAEMLLRTLRYAVERKRNQRELLDRNHRLALLNRIVRRDIRNDASMIVGRGEQLRHRVEPGGEAALEAVLEAADHLVELTDTAAGLMDVLSADDLQREPCDLDAVLDAAIARVRRERDVTITIDRYDDADEPMTVYGSPMLESAFEHLLCTAIDHSDRTAPHVTATLTVDASSNRASIDISGDGIEIPAKQRELLVDADARLERGSGMDIGLYLVTTVLEDVDGEIEIDDATRETTVTVTFERLRQG